MEINPTFPAFFGAWLVPTTTTYHEIFPVIAVELFSPSDSMTKDRDFLTCFTGTTPRSHIRKDVWSCGMTKIIIRKQIV